MMEELLKLKEKILLGTTTESDADIINDIISSFKEEMKPMPSMEQSDMIPIEEEKKAEIGSSVIYTNLLIINYCNCGKYPPTTKGPEK